MSCVDTGPFNGGVYNDSTIINPDITKGTATNIEIKSSSLTGGVSVDNITANQLMQAIQEQNPVFLADKPQSSTGTDLPTEIVGEDRSQVLGKPAGFIKLGSYMVPVYRAK
jgi:hypothetical protein